VFERSTSSVRTKNYSTIQFVPSQGFEKLRQGYLSLEDKKANGIEFEILKKAEIFVGMEEQLLLSYINESDVDENKVCN